MLVISRMPNQGVWIGNVFVIIADVRGDKVRLGIEAPKDTDILREELLPPEVHEQKREESRMFSSQYEKKESIDL